MKTASRIPLYFGRLEEEMQLNFTARCQIDLKRKSKLTRRQFVGTLEKAKKQKRAPKGSSIIR